MCSAVRARIPPKWPPGRGQRAISAGDTRTRQSQGAAGRASPLAGLAPRAHAHRSVNETSVAARFWMDYLWIRMKMKSLFSKSLAELASHIHETQKRNERRFWKLNDETEMLNFPVEPCQTDVCVDSQTSRS